VANGACKHHDGWAAPHLKLSWWRGCAEPQLYGCRPPDASSFEHCGFPGIDIIRITNRSWVDFRAALNAG
jgi:hypothetical protein